MKKILILAMAALFGVSHVSADNFTAGNITVPKGGSAVIEIGLDNTDNLCKGFQFLLNFDGAVTASSPVRGARVSDKYTLDDSQKEEGYQILAYTTGTTTLTGTSGTIVRITLTADESLDVGATVTGTLSDGRISDETGTSHHLGDVEFTVTIGEPDDGRIKFDETKTTLPTYTAGEKGNVTMKRTIKAGEWSTLVLPFNLTKKAATDIFGSDVQMAMFSGFKVDYGDDEENITPLGIQLNFTAYTIPAKGNLAGGTPILIKTSQNIETIEVDNCTLVGAVTDVTVKDKYETSGKFTGTFVKTTVPEDGLFISGNEFWYSVGLTNIKAFRGWFELGAVLGKDTDFGANIRYTVYDEATGIKEMVNVKGQKEAADGWYTLDGRKLSGKPTEKGVYIFNNKKVAIQ